jgi:hypothetical protein
MPASSQLPGEKRLDSKTTSSRLVTMQWRSLNDIRSGDPKCHSNRGDGVGAPYADYVESPRRRQGPKARDSRLGDALPAGIGTVHRLERFLCTSELNVCIHVVVYACMHAFRFRACMRSSRGLFNFKNKLSMKQQRIRQ